jgi:hypothetical protein
VLLYYGWWFNWGAMLDDTSAKNDIVFRYIKWHLLEEQYRTRWCYYEYCRRTCIVQAPCLNKDTLFVKHLLLYLMHEGKD